MMVEARWWYGASLVIPHKRKVKPGGSDALEVWWSKVSEDENVWSKWTPVDVTSDNAVSKDSSGKKRQCLLVGGRWSVTRRLFMRRVNGGCVARRMLTG